LNSRACRSALMFNDELSKEQCRTIISRLSECAFPFQCAHGRPSLIPLVDLGMLGTFGDRVDGDCSLKSPGKLTI
jgi:DNA mismatch repair protein MLH3